MTIQDRRVASFSLAFSLEDGVAQLAMETVVVIFALQAVGNGIDAFKADGAN